MTGDTDSVTIWGWTTELNWEGKENCWIPPHKTVQKIEDR